MTWASATPSVATITPAGLATGVATGTSTITATLNGVSGSTVLTVTAASLVVDRRDSLEPEPREGLTQQFTATGTYTDNSTQNLTSEVTWASATPSVATITPAGLATGAATGTSTITATLNGVSRLDGTDRDGGGVGFDRGDAVEPEHRRGRDRAVHGDGHLYRQLDPGLDDSGDLVLGHVHRCTVNSGLASGAAPGTATISAALNGVTGSTVLTVTAATLVSIAVTPSNPSLAQGVTQQFTATGTYSDFSTQNLTSQVTWASATPSVATITTAGLADGRGDGQVDDLGDV